MVNVPEGTETVATDRVPLLERVAVSLPVSVPVKVTAPPLALIVELPVTAIAPEVVKTPVVKRVPVPSVIAAALPPILVLIPTDKVPAEIVVPPE